MRCLTVSKGTVIEKSRLHFPADVNLRKVAPGNHFGTYLTSLGWVWGISKPGTVHLLTEWKDVDYPLSGCETALDSIHRFVRAVEYRMIGGFDIQSIRDLQRKRIRQTLWGTSVV